MQNLYRICSESMQDLCKIDRHIFLQDLRRICLGSLQISGRIYQNLLRIYPVSMQTMQARYRICAECILKLTRICTESDQNLQRIYAASMQDLCEIYENLCRIYTEIATGSVQDLRRIS